MKMQRATKGGQDAMTSVGDGNEDAPVSIFHVGSSNAMVEKALGMIAIRRCLEEVEKEMDFLQQKGVQTKIIQGNAIQANMVLKNTEFFNELGSKLPLYAFQRLKNNESSDKKEPPFAFLGSLLLEWEDCVERGLFCYDVTACETKVEYQKYGLLSTNRASSPKKRSALEFRVDKVLQPFDRCKFTSETVDKREMPSFQYESSGWSVQLNMDTSFGFHEFLNVCLKRLKKRLVIRCEEFLESLTDVFFVQREPFRAHLSNICMGAVDDIGSSRAPVPSSVSMVGTWKPDFPIRISDCA
ncbi:GDP-L-galactose phosphorylase 1-like protein [Tanacetum coccineum]